MNNLEIKHLRMLSAIAETGNMTKAAQRLFVSQSALSQQLKDIEGKLEVDLFFRTRKRMILTPIGKKLLGTARQVVGALEHIELDIARLVSGDGGEFKVGVQCVYCYKWLPGVMEKFQKKFPNVELGIGSSVDPALELQANRYDFIITVIKPGDDDFVCLPLFEDQLVCIMPDDHPLCLRSHICLEDFNGFKLISHADKEQSRFYQQVLKPKDIEPKGLMVVEQPPAIIEMVAAGLGVSVFPRWAVGGRLKADGITMRPITRSGFPLTWHAAFLKNGQMPIFQKEFINIIRKMNINGS